MVTQHPAQARATRTISTFADAVGTSTGYWSVAQATELLGVMLAALEASVGDELDSALLHHGLGDLLKGLADQSRQISVSELQQMIWDVGLLAEAAMESSLEITELWAVPMVADHDVVAVA